MRLAKNLLNARIIKKRFNIVYLTNRVSSCLRIYGFNLRLSGASFTIKVVAIGRNTAFISLYIIK